MSYQWTSNAISSIAKVALEQARLEAKSQSMIWLYDNIQIARRVSEQRIDNQNQFDSGTALTVIMLPEAARLGLDRKRLDEFHRIGSKKQPNLLALLDPEMYAS